MVAVARAAAPNIAFTGWTSTDGPPAIQGREDGAVAVPPLLKLVAKASEQGFDGIIIGCFDDTGLAEAAAIARCPVLGIGQAAYHMAALRQWRFSVVTTLGVSVPILEENIAASGQSAFLARVRASEVPVLALEEDPEAARRTIIAEAQAAISAEKPDCIVLGCGGMAKLAEDMQAELGVPVIDGVQAAARLIRALA